MAPPATEDAFFAALSSSKFADSYGKKSLNNHPRPLKSSAQKTSASTDIDKAMAQSSPPGDFTTTTGTEKMNMLTRVHAFEHAVIQEVKLLCSSIQSLQLKPTHTGPQTHPTTTTQVTHVRAPVPQPTDTVSNNFAPPPTIPVSREAHLPLYIKRLPVYMPTSLSTTPLTSTPTNPLTFTHTFLLATLGGSEYSPSLYHPATHLTPLLTEDTTARLARLKKPIKSQQPRPEKRTYYLFDERVNPYVPVVPGGHGAALSLFFRDFEHAEEDGVYVDVPVFVALRAHNGHLEAGGVDEAKTMAEGTPDSAAAVGEMSGAGLEVEVEVEVEGENVTEKTEKEKEKVYTYMGQYTQSRWSDRLSAPQACSASDDDNDNKSDSAPRIPAPTTAHWTALLTSPLRPAWLTEKLLHHLVPCPSYTTPVPNPGDEVTSQTREEIEAFFEEMREWREDGEAMVKGLDANEVRRLLGEADCAGTPGLRWWWEYLECVGFDRGFVYQLGTLAKGPAGSEGGRNGEENGDTEGPAGFGA